ncbi:MAG TPA: DUF4350 domain-containing protein [Verrucomicrobiae bacterium]|nr:DUF4350 domain-containing protein [Verrucomicrobiae bacterium]
MAAFDAPDAVRRALSPRPSGLLFAAALLLFVAERLLTEGAARGIVLGAAALAWLLGSAWCALLWRRAPASARGLLALQLACAMGVLLGAALYAAAVQADTGTRQSGEVAALWLIGSVVAFALSLAALAALALVAAPMRSAGFVESLRVRQALGGGLALACAVCGLGFVNWTASYEDVRADLSYGAPTRPTAATLSLVQAAGRPVEIHLFFARGSPVLAEISDYFDALAAQGAQVHVQDQALDMALAKSLGVTRNGTVAVRSGERREVWYLGEERDEARRHVKDLEEGMRARLSKVTRELKSIYMTYGHGERMEGRAGAGDRAAASQFHQLARALNAKIKRLGVAEGFGESVPEDAELIVVHGPTAPFQPAEVAQLEAYLRRGGALLLMLDPGTQHGLDPLLRTLGLAAPGVTLANEREFVRQTQTRADHGFIYSRSFVNHRAVRTLGESVRNAALMVRDAGQLVRLDGASDARVTFLARTRPFTFEDTDGDWTRDPDEKQGLFELVAAAELPAAEGREARVIVTTDSDILADGMVSNEANAAFGLDTSLWLLRDDATSGDVAGAEDVPIRHTRDQDTLWFYASTFAVPLLALAAGLASMRRRRARPA